MKKLICHCGAIEAEINLETWLLLAILGIVLAKAIRVNKISKILKKNKNKKD